jgi:hypothetical protein
MNNEAQCLGNCLIDPDTGACLGCGRLPEEISGVPVAHGAGAPPPPDSRPLLPAAVAAQVGEGTQ